MKRKMLTNNHELEKKLQKIEKLMEKEGIFFRTGCHGNIRIEYQNQKFYLYDIDTSNYVFGFPRQFEQEKIILDE